MSVLNIDIGNNWTIAEIIHAIDHNSKITLTKATIDRIKQNRSFLENKLNEGGTFYGINTGFGSLCDTIIPEEHMVKMQENLVKSHACGTGYELDESMSKLIFLLKIINLSKAYSGVRLELIEHMINIYNAGILPVIFEQGSLGASGDLSPLAHLSLMLIGEGRCYYKNEKRLVSDTFKEASITPIILREKEGLALLNGTQFSLAHAVVCCDMAEKALFRANKIAAASIEAFACKLDAYHPLIGEIRNNGSQQKIAQLILQHCENGKKPVIYSVQDPYSFRCIPQVHGATLTCIEHVKNVVENELNAVTDNPNIFDKEGLIISGGNFHAQNLALVLDYLCLGVSELANIAERRIYQLINGDRNLPPFLTKDAGLNSGFMIAQYTAASIVSQNKQLCTPASVDSITSSKGQEDHVSMASNGGTKCLKVCNNTCNVLSIELLVAMQGIDFRGLEKAAPFIAGIHQKFRKTVSFMDGDRIIHDDIILSRKFYNELN